MNKAEILELALRVEALEGPDRELDAEIAHATCWRWEGWEEGDLRIEERDLAYVIQRVELGFNSVWRNLPAYTSSIDAAMGLVPEGWAVESISAWPASPEGADNKTPAQSNARLLGASMKRFGKQMIWGHSREDGRTKGEASTPACALTAACLRAIASTMEDDRG